MPSRIANICIEEQDQETAEEGESGSSRTPKGHFVVYVGKEMRRFVVPTRFLKNPSFQKLLEEAAEEFGFVDARRTKIVLPCDVSSFRQLLSSLSSYQDRRYLIH